MNFLFCISLSTCDPLVLPDWHALPLEHAIPFKSRWKSSIEALSLDTSKPTILFCKGGSVSSQASLLIRDKFIGKILVNVTNGGYH